MTAVLAVLVFAFVWLVITVLFGWTIEAVLHRWVERRFGVKARCTYSRGWHGESLAQERGGISGQSRPFMFSGL